MAASPEDHHQEAVPVTSAHGELQGRLGGVACVWVARGPAINGGSVTLGGEHGCGLLLQPLPWPVFDELLGIPWALGPVVAWAQALLPWGAGEASSHPTPHLFSRDSMALRAPHALWTRGVKEMARVSASTAQGLMWRKSLGTKPSASVALHPPFSSLSWTDCHSPQGSSTQPSTCPLHLALSLVRLVTCASASPLSSGTSERTCHRQLCNSVLVHVMLG